MKERPILFNAPMVRALLDGSKTQTRRAVKQIDPAKEACTTNFHGDPMPVCWAFGGPVIPCPYGQPGDRLWVRETWGVVSNAWDEDGAIVDWTPDRPATTIHEMKFGKGYYSGYAIYAADGSYQWAGDDDGGGEPRTAWHPSIHMPRVASRVLLEIVSVRVERLQAISETDALAEGVQSDKAGGHFIDSPAARCAAAVGAPAVEAYQTLWELINGAGSWAVNPWVWVIEFRRLP